MIFFIVETEANPPKNWDIEDSVTWLIILIQELVAFLYADKKAVTKLTGRKQPIHNNDWKVKYLDIKNIYMKRIF